MNAQHLFAQFFNLLAHDLLHRPLLWMSDPAHFGREEEFFEISKGKALSLLADLRDALFRLT